MKFIKVFLYIIDDLLYIAGLAAIAIGVSMIYEPAAWISAGCGLVAYAIMIARK